MLITEAEVSKCLIAATDDAAIQAGGGKWKLQLIPDK